MAPPTYGTQGTYRQGSSAAPAFSAPASIVSTSIVIIDMYLDAGATISSLPSGFAHAAGSPLTVNPGGGGEHKLVRIWARNPAGSTYTVSLSANVYSNGVASRADGCVATGDPWDTNSGTGTAAATASDIDSGTTPDVSMTTQNNDQLKWFSATNWGGGNWTPPTAGGTWTEQLDTGDKTLTIDTLAQTTAGATGNVNATCAVSDRRAALLGSLLSVALGGSDVNAADTPVIGLAMQGANETGVAIGVNVADSPSGIRLGSASGSGVSVGVVASDSSSGARLGSASPGAFSIGVGASDAPNGLRFGSPAETITYTLLTSDAPGGLRTGTGAETAGVATTVPDAPNGLRFGSSAESLTISITALDPPGGVRLGLPSATAAYDVLAVDSSSGLRLGTPSQALAFGVQTLDASGGIRLGNVSQSIAIGVQAGDTPSGARIGSGATSVTITAGGILDSPFGLRMGSAASTVTGESSGIVPPITIYAPVGYARPSGGVEIPAIDGSVRRFQA